MDVGSTTPSSSDQLGKVATRLSLHQNHLLAPSSPRSPSTSAQSQSQQKQHKQPTMSRDPITCHVLNTLTGTPAANLPVILTLLSTPSNPSAQDVAFIATTNADGRVANWAPLSNSTDESTAQSQSASATVAEVLSTLPASDSKTNWALTFNVGPWFEAQGVESFWPEVEVKITVKGRGKEGLEGWRHYHIPVLLGPWSYSTYRGS